MAKKNTRQPNAVTAMIDKRRREIHSDWCARHPELAAEQRRLRLEVREIAAIRGASVKKKRVAHEGTPETLVRASRTRQGALARLYQSGAISIEQLGSALEIAAVHERIGSDVRIRTVSLDTRINQCGRYDGAFFEALGQVRREVAYSAWRNELPGPSGPILDMIIDDIGVTLVARQHQMHVRRARRMLTESLDLWPRMISRACAKIDEADLLAAHAGLL